MNNLKPINIYSSGLVYCSVCAPAEMTADELTQAVNLKNPTGLEHGWQIASEPFKDCSENPHTCEQDSSRKHWLLSC